MGQQQRQQQQQQQQRFRLILQNTREPVNNEHPQLHCTASILSFLQSMLLCTYDFCFSMNEIITIVWYWKQQTQKFAFIFFIPTELHYSVIRLESWLPGSSVPFATLK